MSEEIIKLNFVEYVQVTTSQHALDDRRIRLLYARDIESVTCGSSNQAALSNAEKIGELIMRSRDSAWRARTQLLQLIQQVEHAHITFTRDLENEMHRLRNLSGEYNAAKEQAERKDNVV